MKLPFDRARRRWLATLGAGALAASGIIEAHSGQAFSDGAGAFFKRLTCLTSRNTAKATMVKSMIVLMNMP